MRLSDGWQRFELGTWRDPPSLGEPLSAREFESVLQRSPSNVMRQAGEFLVEHFGWPALETDRDEAIQARLVELVDAGSVHVVVFTPSGSEAGDVPDEDDVENLAELASEEDDDYGAAAQVEEPPMFEAGFEAGDPDMVEADFEIAPPIGFDVGFEIG